MALPSTEPGDRVGEILARLSMKPIDAMSEPEKVFWAVASFTIAALESVDEALQGDTGRLLPVFAEFANRYGTPEVVAVADSLVAARDDPDAVEGLDEAFAACEASIEAGLLALARRNADRFGPGSAA